MQALLEKFDGWSLRNLVRINVAIGALGALANGGFLLVTRSDGTEQWAAGGLLVGALVTLIAGLRSFGTGSLVVPARVQGLLLLVFASAALLQGVGVALNGLPDESRFTWNPPLVVAFVSYAVYFARRAFLSAAQMRTLPFQYAHLGAAILATIISAVVIARLT